MSEVTKYKRLRPTSARQVKKKRTGHKFGKSRPAGTSASGSSDQGGGGPYQQGSAVSPSSVSSMEISDISPNEDILQAGSHPGCQKKPPSARGFSKDTNPIVVPLLTHGYRNGERMAPRPFKVCDRDRNEQIGVVASSIDAIKTDVRKYFGMEGEEQLTIVVEADGTVLQSDNYFDTLPNYTLLMMLNEGFQWTPRQVSRPLKVCNVNRTMQIGVAAPTIDKFKTKVKKWFEVEEHLTVKLVEESDGTEITDDEYFKSLSKYTPLIVLKENEIWTPRQGPLASGP